MSWVVAKHSETNDISESMYKPPKGEHRVNGYPGHPHTEQAHSTHTLLSPGLIVLGGEPERAQWGRFAHSIYRAASLRTHQSQSDCAYEHKAEVQTCV